MAGSKKGINNHKLTPKQRKFAQEYAVNGGNANKAAIIAGYEKSNKWEGSYGNELTRNPKVKAEIHRIQENKICGKLASVALGTLEGIMGDPQAPAPARVRAATWVLECAGHGRKGITEDQGREEADLSSMSISQLEEHLQRLQGDLAQTKRAQVIDVSTGPDAQDTAQKE